ncbi:MAG: lytic transglycosylase domain-containing protein [Ktedonobacteraceae bacterium]|nr:lytic transglycosylase domain-containing protein [Ktedonobacteraceae bacterium]
MVECKHTYPPRDQVSDTNTSPYWAGYHVQGYIHPSWLTASPAPRIGMDTLPNSPYVAVARDAARVSGIDVGIFLRMINQESGFRPDAVSSAGAVGIAQLMPETTAGLGVNPRDPTSSLYAAARLLSGHLRNYGGDYAKALASYNAGADTVNQAVSRCTTRWRVCLPDETQRYLHAILQDA